MGLICHQELYNSTLSEIKITGIFPKTESNYLLIPSPFQKREEKYQTIIHFYKQYKYLNTVKLFVTSFVIQ